MRQSSVEFCDRIGRKRRKEFEIVTTIVGLVCATQLSCISSPSAAHTIKAIRTVAARYSVIVMIAPGLIPMSEILLAIAPIPRREPGNFSTLTRNFLDRPRCSG